MVRLVFHADNGGPYEGRDDAGHVAEAGVGPSFSRSAVSDDNPYAESVFRTLKYNASLSQPAV